MNPTTRAYLKARRDFDLDAVDITSVANAFDRWRNAGCPDADEPAQEPVELDLGNGLHIKLERGSFPEPAPRLDPGTHARSLGWLPPDEAGALQDRAQKAEAELANEKGARESWQWEAKQLQGVIAELRTDAESVRATNADLRDILDRIAEVLDFPLTTPRDQMPGWVEALKAESGDWKRLADQRFEEVEAYSVKLGAVLVENDALRRDAAESAKRAYEWLCVAQDLRKSLASRTLGARLRRALGVGR